MKHSKIKRKIKRNKQNRFKRETFFSKIEPQHVIYTVALVIGGLWAFWKTALENLRYFESNIKVYNMLEFSVLSLFSLAVSTFVVLVFFLYFLLYIL